MNRTFATIAFTCAAVTALGFLSPGAFPQSAAINPSPHSAVPALYVYDFYASWCHNCTAIKPILSMVQNNYRGVVQIVPIDVDAPQNQNLVAQASITGVPTLVIVDKQGKPLRLFIGADQAQQLEPTLRLLLRPATNAVPRRSVSHT